MEGLKFYSSAQAEGFQLAGIARLLFPHYYYYNNNKLGEREKKKLRLGGNFATSFSSEARAKFFAFLSFAIPFTPPRHHLPSEEVIRGGVR